MGGVRKIIFSGEKAYEHEKVSGSPGDRCGARDRRLRRSRNPNGGSNERARGYQRTPVQPTPAVGAPTASAGVPAGVGLIKGPFAGEAQTLNGAGATFPAVLYSKWFDEYSKLTSVKVNYQAIGSGGGIKGCRMPR